jgi:hypothetical protein
LIRGRGQGFVDPSWARVLKRARPSDHDDLGLNQSKIIVIDSNSLERDAG